MKIFSYFLNHKWEHGQTRSNEGTEFCFIGFNWGCLTKFQMVGLRFLTDPLLFSSSVWSPSNPQGPSSWACRVRIDCGFCPPSTYKSRVETATWAHDFNKVCVGGKFLRMYKGNRPAFISSFTCYASFSLYFLTYRWLMRVRPHIWKHLNVFLLVFLLMSPLYGF